MCDRMRKRGVRSTANTYGKSQTTKMNDEKNKRKKQRIQRNKWKESDMHGPGMIAPFAKVRAKRI